METGLLTSQKSSKALLADGKPRCFVQSGIGMKGGKKWRCLPNVFSIGVSKCGEFSQLTVVVMVIVMVMAVGVSVR